MEANEPDRKRHKHKLRPDERAAMTRVLAPFIQVRKKPQQPLPIKLDVDEQYRHVYNQTKPDEVLARLSAYFTDSLELPTVLNETSTVLKNITHSDGVALYLVDEGTNHIILNQKYIFKNPRYLVKYPIEPGTTLAAYVAHIQEFVISNDILGDARFPDGIPGVGSSAKAVMALPVMTTASGKCIAVIELYRTEEGSTYTSNDLQVSVAVTGWMGAAIHQNNERLALDKDIALSKYLLNLIHLYCSDIITFDKFISDIVICAKISVGAERGSFFIIEDIPESEDDYVMTSVYEESIDSTQMTFKKKTKQKFCKEHPGIAGVVARTGQVVNITDAYKHVIFAQQADILGFRTRSVIGVPVKTSLGVWGVLMLTNKVNGPFFTKQDETLLETLACYSLLACQRVLIDDRLKKTKNELAGHLDMLNFHMSPCVGDLRDLSLRNPLAKKDLPPGFFGFDWYLLHHENKLDDYLYYMFTHEMCNNSFNSRENLTEFILCARKSYRNNPYHNFEHAFTVCHCMFNILLRNTQRFSTFEIVALLIACICHDADHFGFTNNFLAMKEHWLAELYTESSLEHHHFDVCMLLINKTEILENFSSSEYNLICETIESCIVATDLAMYFRNKGPLSNLIKTGTFDWVNHEHKKSFISIMMTACDLSGNCKPFEVAKRITDSLYREFYNQGDEEKRLGVCPLAMMDRTKSESIPEDQIQFLSLVCIPCVELLSNIFPNTENLLFQCLDLRDRWRDLYGKKNVDVWKPSESLCVYKKVVGADGKSYMTVSCKK